MDRAEFKAWHKTLRDSQSRFRTLSLFWELRSPEREEKNPPIFTLKDHPHTVPSFDKKGLVTYPSLKQIYLSYDHIPGNEYEFAMDVFGSWQHWQVIAASNHPVLSSKIKEWKEELAVKNKCSALKKMILASDESSATGVNAAKYLADEGYLQRKVGRMTKEEKERVQKIEAGVRDTLAEDMNRLGLELITGSK